MPRTRSSRDSTIEPHADFWPAAQRRRFLAALQAWSADSGRQLPWRDCGDAYRVWLSEIMLQQTTVAAVIPYFERFLQQFPTVHDLAAAEEDAVLRLWEGLGYYSRARNLHRAAKQIMTSHAGQFPTDLAALRALPGVGRYTAGAIASFAFQLPAAIVEANTQRLYARLLGEDRELKSSAVQQRLWQFAEFLVDAAGGDQSHHATQQRLAQKTSAGPMSPGAINQALMDLGATVCTPTAPACDQCPVRAWCAAAADGRQHAIPRLPPRPVITELTDATVAIVQRGKYLLRRRATDERWAGLWDFPRCTIPDGHDPATVLTEHVRQQTGLEIAIDRQLVDFRHSVTRYRIHLRCFRGRVVSGQLPKHPDLRWTPPTEFDQFPLSVTGRKFARTLHAAE